MPKPKRRVSPAGRAAYGRAKVRHWEAWRVRHGHLFKYPQRRIRGPLSDAVRKNEQRKCEVRFCQHNRKALSRYCQSHADHLTRHGHVTARNIRRLDFEVFVGQAKAFVEEQHSVRGGLHPSLLAAMRWMRREIAAAERAEPASDPKLHKYREAILHAYRNGVTVEEFVCRALAGVLIEDAIDMYADGRHAIAQKARLILYTQPFIRLWPRKDAPGLTKQDALYPRASGGRPSYGLRVFTHQRVNSALGVLALAASRFIRSQRTADTDHLIINP